MSVHLTVSVWSISDLIVFLFNPGESSKQNSEKQLFYLNFFIEVYLEFIKRQSPLHCVHPSILVNENQGNTFSNHSPRSLLLLSSYSHVILLQSNPWPAITMD